MYIMLVMGKLVLNKYTVSIVVVASENIPAFEVCLS